MKEKELNSEEIVVTRATALGDEFDRKAMEASPKYYSTRITSTTFWIIEIVSSDDKIEKKLLKEKMEDYGFLLDQRFITKLKLLKDSEKAIGVSIFTTGSITNNDETVVDMNADLYKGGEGV